MTKDLKNNVVAKITKGRVYHYYRITGSVDGKRRDRYIRITAEPGTEEFDRQYWAIRSGQHTVSKTTFSALVQHYMTSRRYTKLADGTKRKYRPILDDLRAKSGDVDVTTVRRSDIRAIHQKYSATPRMADHRLQVLRLLFNEAIDLE